MDSLVELELKRKLRAALTEKAALIAQERFLTFVQLLRPMFTKARHHEIIAEHLEAVESGSIRRLMIWAPPRSSKSEMISRLFPAWWLGRHPNHEVLSVSYAVELAQTFGKEVRDIIQSPEYAQVFPATRISASSRAMYHWETTAGGIYNAAGITGGIAGKGAHIGLIDDPLNEQDAYSKAKIEHVKRWWPAGFTSRLMPDARVIILSTRWNEEDLSGFVLRESENNSAQVPWTVLSIEALLEERGSKLLGYPVGTSFWPVNDEMKAKGSKLPGWSTKELKERRAGMPDYQWQALYMQRPSAVEGAIIMRDYWQKWKKTPLPVCQYKVLSLDTAFSTASTADYSACVVWGVFEPPNKEKEDIKGTDHNFIALHSEKGRWAFPELRQKVLDLYRKHTPDIILIEKKASGQSLIQDLERSLLPIYAYEPDRDKAARAHACTPLFKQGRIWTPDPELLENKWAAELIDECARFSPSGAAHDDLVDATTQAILWVRSNLMLRLEDEPHWWDSSFKQGEPRRRRSY